MKKNKLQFLDLADSCSDLENAAFCILPYPFEGGISYHAGAGRAPKAILQASAQVELYDEILDAEPWRAGICTLKPGNIPKTPQNMSEHIYRLCSGLLQQQKFLIVIGGDHSISSGYFRALCQRHHPIGVIQLDAHADLRPQYQNDAYSHASVMARIREYSQHTLQLGIRSLCRQEAELIRRQHLDVCMMHDLRQNRCDLLAAVKRMPHKVFLTIDVDVFDTGVIQHTGTPEPGGFTWYEALQLLQTIFRMKNVVGFDLVELACHKDDWVSPFAAAKLLYKMIGLKIDSLIKQNKLEQWPLRPLEHIPQ